MTRVLNPGVMAPLTTTPVGNPTFFQSFWRSQLLLSTESILPINRDITLLLQYYIHPCLYFCVNKFFKQMPVYNLTSMAAVNDVMQMKNV